MGLVNMDEEIIAKIEDRIELVKDDLASVIRELNDMVNDKNKAKKFRVISVSLSKNMMELRKLSLQVK
jgi:hypothetical protein